MARSTLQLSSISFRLVSLAALLLPHISLASMLEHDAHNAADEAVLSKTNGDAAEETCVTTVTASTTASSLMQAMSSRSRLKDGVEVSKAEKRHDKHSSGQKVAHIKEGHSTHFVDDDTSDKVKAHQTHEHKTSGGKESSKPCLLHSSMSAAMSLFQKGHALGLSALGRFNTGSFGLSDMDVPLRQAVLASTGALILIFCLLAVLGASAFLAMVSLHQTSDPHVPSELAPHSNSQYGSRLYLPMTASNAPSLRPSRASPEIATKRLPFSTSPEAAKLQSNSRIPLTQAAVQDLASSEEDASNVRKPRATATAMMHFCPDLVVPQHCECILVLPLDIFNTRVSFTIMDVQGSPVLKAVPESAAGGRPWRAIVTTSTGETLVTCQERRLFGLVGQPDPQPDAEYELKRANGQVFAKMTHDPTQDKYLLTLQGGIVLSIWGNFDESAVNMTGEGNRLLATTEIGHADFDKDGRYCRLRVAPSADVGLALCGLLGIGQHLQRKWQNKSARI